MLSKLERKRREIRNEFNLIKRRFQDLDISFEIEKITNSMMSTETDCDILLFQFRAMNKALDKIPLKKD